MKIAILTFQWANNKNYGASLQSYACRKLVEKVSKAEIVKIIDYNPIPLKLKEKLKVSFFTSTFKFFQFNKKFLQLTQVCKNEKVLKELNNEYDTFIVGSDQVWRGIWFLESKTHYFFDFVNKDKKKIAYAASFGVDNWEGTPKLTKKIEPLIKKFEHISVREKSGVDICKNVFNVEAEWVLDPTLMLNRDEYQPILDDYTKKNHLKKKYIAYMILDHQKEIFNFSEEISKKLKLELINIRGFKGRKLGIKMDIFNKVSQWLTYLKDSELLITDSFHCTVFSLIFHRKFIVIANKKRGTARLESLLSMVGLEDRLITNIEKCNIEEIINKEINYEEVDKKIEKERERSLIFLKKALGVN